MKKDISRGRHSAKAAARRRQIVDAAADCFRRSGFRGASMTDISAAARMSVGHIYYYFSSKEDIVESVIDRATFGVQSILDKAVCTAFGIPMDEDKDAGVCDPCLVLAAFTEALYNPAVNSVFLEHESKNFAALKSLMNDERAKGRLVPGLNETAASTMLTGLLFGLIIRAALSPGSGIADVRKTLKTLLKVIVVSTTPLREQ